MKFLGDIRVINKRDGLGDEIGRHVGLRSRCLRRVGSSPILGNVGVNKWLSGQRRWTVNSLCTHIVGSNPTLFKGS